MYFVNASACKASPTFGKISYKLFFPAYGIYDVAGLPEINPKYVSPAIEIDATKDVADIGVATLSGSIPGAGTSIAAPKDDVRNLLVGFGSLAFKKGAEKIGFKSNIAHQEGAEIISGQPRPLEDSGSCPEAAADTMCIWYNSLPASSGPKQTTSLCPADSGSPLLAYGPSGVGSLIGLASYYAPSSVQNCDSTDNRRSYFVRLDRHSDWLKQFQSAENVSAPHRDCVEGIVGGPSEFDLNVDAGTLTLTAFDEERFGRPRPAVTIAGTPQPRCQSVSSTGIFACEVGKATVRISLSAGYGQITYCKDRR
ncbi:hypothetical protein [Bradyrhizobium sp. UNPF46]|uniref:hypothetical protein n=1 Tax=Bradyrhizobium sp. UNPF46 TaxID=1141168 RepID=UPI001FEF1228|nr:hypothetical protein [Bradyrhizobium sp. UNPF46]